MKDTRRQLLGYLCIAIFVLIVLIACLIKLTNGRGKGKQPQQRGEAVKTTDIPTNSPVPSETASDDVQEFTQNMENTPVPEDEMEGQTYGMQAKRVGLLEADGLYDKMPGDVYTHMAEKIKIWLDNSGYDEVTVLLVQEGSVKQDGSKIVYICSSDNGQDVTIRVEYDVQTEDIIVEESGTESEGKR